MRRLGICIFVFALVGSASAGSEWTRYRLFVRDATEAQRVSDSSLELFSDNVVIGETDVIVGPNEAHELLRLGIPFAFVSTLPNPKGWDIGYPEGIDYRNQYFRYNTILTQFEEWRTTKPNLVSRQQIGTSWGNRPIYAYRVAPVGRTAPDKSVVMIFGIHAREWISPAVGMHLFERMLNHYSGPGGSAASYNYGGPRFPTRTAYYFIPVLNPDGYEYTWTNNRMWRKNRRNIGGGVYGVDLNRNFSKGWGGGGSSGDPSSSTYRGPSAFSEPETNGLRNWMDTIPPVVGFIDFHSYGQYILWAWGYSFNQAPGETWLRATGFRIRDDILAVYGRSYTTGPTSSTLYQASGVSPDYVYDRFNAAAYTIELRDDGEFGFILPENQIAPTQDEAWQGTIGFIERVLNR